VSEAELVLGLLLGVGLSVGIGGFVGFFFHRLQILHPQVLVLEMRR